MQFSKSNAVFKYLFKLNWTDRKQHVIQLCLSSGVHNYIDMKSLTRIVLKDQIITLS